MVSYAAVTEMTDRVRAGNWDDDLDKVLYDAMTP